MRSMTKACAICATLAALCAPARARADGYFNPWIGANGASATDTGNRAFGATTGYMGGGVFGFEADFGYTPDFFGTSNVFRTGSAVTIMTNAILGVPIGGTHGAGVRPFVSGGVGLIRTDREAPVVNQVRNDFGYNLGAGMMGFFNQHIGLRGDVKYLGTLQDIGLGSDVNVEPGLVRYWRVSAGLTFR
jgi:hypothetical protein